MQAFDSDPDIPWEELKAANERHDKEKHTVSMWRRAGYRGRFNYPPDPKQKKRRDSNLIVR